MNGVDAPMNMTTVDGIVFRGCPFCGTAPHVRKPVEKTDPFVVECTMAICLAQPWMAIHDLHVLAYKWNDRPPMWYGLENCPNCHQANEQA